MNARFRLVHFVPDPFLGGRVPIAALIEQNGTVSVVSLPHIPGPNCLGGRKASSLVQLILDDLRAANHFNQLPSSLGPQALLDKERTVPADVGDVRKWLETCLSVSQPVSADNEHTKRPHRATWGYRFFQTHKVDRYVKKTFKPGQDADNFLLSASTLGAISHYVEGDKEFLLMEPIVPRKPNWEDDVQQVAKTFGAYKTAIRHEKLRRKPRFMAYILAGGTEEARKSMINGLAPFADYVADTENNVSRVQFLARIRETGQSGTHELIKT